ncbi:DUF6233 domain-containing protein [Streptomyces sp. NPDC050400]|uniref:DUF6233 domain-containing protein n=1 Tax=Streptomyces sp. NPDC050400 TaxID=3365610 RepID=UPI0037880179
MANRSPEPDWLIERGFGDQPATYVRAATCWCAPKGIRLRGIAEDQARRALAEGVPPCAECRPESVPGIL